MQVLAPLNKLVRTKTLDINGRQGWLAVLFFVANMLAVVICPAASALEVFIDRQSKTLTVMNKQIEHCKVGVGRGGLGEKKVMDDFITPAGKFIVDLVLYQNPEYDEVNAELLQRYKNDPRAKFLRNRQGLQRLFENMNSLDFDHDAKPDTAYGIAYLGLEGLPENGRKPITGPKLSNYGGKVYWYSIALHGTPDEAAHIGKAESGGCIHVPADFLRKLIESKTLRLGSHVTIK